MSAHNAVSILYLALFLATVPVVAFTGVAAYLVGRRSWWLLAAAGLGMVLTLGALLVQRSPWSAAEVDAAMVWLQRGSIALWVVASIWLTVHQMALENGRLAAVRDAMKLGPVRRALRRLWERGDHAGNLANSGDAGH